MLGADGDRRRVGEHAGDLARGASRPKTPGFGRGVVDEEHAAVREEAPQMCNLRVGERRDAGHRPRSTRRARQGARRHRRAPGTGLSRAGALVRLMSSCAQRAGAVARTPSKSSDREQRARIEGPLFAESPRARAARAASRPAAESCEQKAPDASDAALNRNPRRARRLLRGGA